MKAGFIERLKEERLKEQAGTGASPNWDEVRNTWVGDLGELLSQMETWLDDAKRQALVGVSRIDIELGEEDLGNYVASGLRLEFPRARIVSVRPVARIVLGGVGRVDLIRGPRRVVLLRQDGGGWRFHSGPAGIARASLTEETFFEALDELIR